MCHARAVEVVSFGLLLYFSILSGVEPQSNCNYFQNLEPGVTYYAYNLNYPDNDYGTHCTWQTSSSYITKISCNLDMPQSYNCTNACVSVQFSGSNINKYCGYGTFNLSGIDPTIYFDSYDYSTGSKFYCEIKTEDKCQCGWRNPARIVGGTETGINEYPMMAGIYDSSMGIIFCGATIIDTRYVMTAAHCVINKQVSSILIVVGEHNVATGTETDATRTYKIVDYTIHPAYDGNNNDIAICTIDGFIEYNTKVGPVCLPFQHQLDSFNGEIVTVLGWGMLYFGGRKSNTLQKVNLSVIDVQQCANASNIPITYNNICTYTPGKDACQMDSGGPLLWEDPKTRRLVLVGTISSGSGCGSEPGINTRVGGYINWIRDVTSGTQYCEVE